jgi:hypothetical protein
MFLGICSGYNAFPTTLPGVLADSLLHSFFLRVGHDHEHIRQHVAQSVQSCDASKQLLQGEKQQKFYTKRNFINLCVPLFFNPCGFLVFLGNDFI